MFVCTLHMRMHVSLSLYLTLASGSGTADSRHDTPLDGRCPHPYTHGKPTAKVKTLATIMIHETVLITSRQSGMVQNLASFVHSHL